MPLWLKILWTVWVLVWAPLYWRQYGAQNLLYFCDLGNFLIAAALWLESPLFFSWQACGLLLFQSLYTIDLLGAAISGKHVIGGTEYMFDQTMPLFVRLLSLFHVVTPPLLLWAIRRLGYDRGGWKYQTLTAWVVVPINYMLRPESGYQLGAWTLRSPATRRAGMAVSGGLFDRCATTGLLADTFDTAMVDVET